MPLNQALLPEFDLEMANTRKTLERVPEDKFGWKPHEKSSSMVALATHLAMLPSWGAITIQRDSFDIEPAGEPPPRNEPAKSVKDLLEKFDQNVAATRDALASASDEDLLKKWTLLKGGMAVFALPRVAALRTFVMNHNIHHRAQLGVYLRLNDVPVPSIYGPSADEAPF
jgi:uncharacterized damage-inducible protein DinB